MEGCENIHSTAPLIRIRFIGGQIKLIVTDVIGGDEDPRNIRIDEDVLFLGLENSTEDLRLERVNCNE